MAEHTFRDNPFADILEEEPRTAFFSRTAPFGTSPIRRRFTENLFPQVFNRFLGALGTQIRGGETPTLRFEEFLSDPRSFNLEREFFQQPRARRTGFAPPLAPRTRFLTQF